MLLTTVVDGSDGQLIPGRTEIATPACDRGKQTPIMGTIKLNFSLKLSAACEAFIITFKLEVEHVSCDDTKYCAFELFSLYVAATLVNLVLSDKHPAVSHLPLLQNLNRLLDTLLSHR